VVELFGFIDLQLISTVSASIGILAGVVNWIIRSRRAERQRQVEIETRQAELLMGIYDHYLEPEHIDAYIELIHRQWEDYDDFVKRYIDTGKNASFIQIGRYFIGIGVLMKKGLIDISLLYTLLSHPITRIWEKYEQIVQGRRIALGFKLWEDVEYAYHELKKYEEQHAELKT